jgi:hypothetical protein
MMAVSSRIAVLAIMVLWTGCATHGPEQSETGTLIGKVLDDQGNAIGGVRVSLEGKTGEIVTRPDGAFEFTRLYPGLYNVEARTPFFLSRFKEGIRINGGRVTEVQLILTAPRPEETRMGTIQGRVVGEDGSELGAGVVVLGTVRGGVTDSTGRFVFNVEVGTHTVRAICGGYRRVDRKGVDVREGDTTTVNFKLAPAPVRIRDTPSVR